MSRSDALPTTNASLQETPIDADPATLARQYGPLVFRVAYRVLGDAARAEDVQQDVFLRLLEARTEGIASWPAWFSACATRLSIDVLRRQQRWQRLMPQWLARSPATAPSAEQHGLERERAVRLREALGRLSRREAQCFGLRYLEGLEIPAVAASLDLSVNSVSVALHRARRRLETELGHDTAAEDA